MARVKKNYVKPPASPPPVTRLSGKPTEIAGLRLADIPFREGSQFCMAERTRGLGEVAVNGSFALMYRRQDQHFAPHKRMFWVTDSDYEVQEMSHDELVAQVKELANMAD